MILTLFVFIVSLSLVITTAKTLDMDAAYTSIWLSAAAYCETNTYLNRTYKGYTTGFVPVYAIDEAKYDVQGIVGYMPSKSTIYLAYRGSTSLQDWLDNINDIHTDYPLCSGCKVHKGFYKAQQDVYSIVQKYVVDLMAKFPTYTVLITGHSLGAALASLTSLSLLADGSVPSSRLRLFNFGSPRVGNDNFAAYASSTLLDHNRVTHHKDIVPHVPMHEFYTHMNGEWYEDDSGIAECSGYEDPKCSYQWHITSTADHLIYLGLDVHCAPVS